MTGFDASGHIAEETKNARYGFWSSWWCFCLTALSVVAAKGILWSAIATGILGFITTILFLFCTPDLDTVFSLDAPQPFVQIYALALGKKASIFMTAIAVLGLIMVCTASYEMVGFFISWLIEYDCRYRRVFAACFRSCKRRSLAIVAMDRHCGLKRTTSKCSDRHLHLRRRSSLYNSA